jgi:RNA-directed DNA polymerase
MLLQRTAITPLTSCLTPGVHFKTLAGTPQGGVISPLLANIYLHLLDRLWAAKCGSLGKLIRYADDFVVMTPTESQAKEALRQIQFVMSKLGLVLHPEKTRMVDLRRGKGSFVFLGCTIRKKRSILRNPRLHFMQRWPSPKAMKRIRERVHELTDARHSGEDVKQVIAKLNPVLRGWGNYFRTGNSHRKFVQLDTYVCGRLVRWMTRRAGQRKGRVEQWSPDRFFGMGLYRLRGTVKYPVQAASRTSSVSRVQENCTHGLKGVC